MKIGLSLNGVNATIKNLQNAGMVIPTDFRSQLVTQANEIRDRAKQILEEQSSTRTSKKYWTGRLQSAIRTNVKTNETSMVGVEVGVDLRTARYGEWVEIGHRIANPFTGKMIEGSWWEGYHYLEGAYVEKAPDIPRLISDTLKVSLSHFDTRGKRTRSKATGRFVAGFNFN